MKSFSLLFAGQCLLFLALAAPVRADVVLHHWAHMPIRVRFDHGDAFTEQREAQAIAGFAEWSIETGGRVYFLTVQDPKKADVTVHFVNQPYVSSQPGTLGETQTETRGEILKHAQIAFATTGVSPAEMTETAAHEWGHALGIGGHSDDPGDLMYPVQVRYVDADGQAEAHPKRVVGARDLSWIEKAYATLFKAKPVP